MQGFIRNKAVVRLPSFRKFSETTIIGIRIRHPIKKNPDPEVHIIGVRVTKDKPFLKRKMSLLAQIENINLILNHVTLLFYIYIL